MSFCKGILNYNVFIFYFTQTLAFLQKYGKEFGIKRTKMLPVSGAFHTELMNTNGREQKAFYKFLGEVNYSRPKYPVYLNFEGKQ